MQQERCRNEEKGVARLSHGDSGGLRVTRFDPFDTARAIELAIYYWSRPKHPCDGPACRASTVLLYNSSARGKSPDVAGGGKRSPIRSRLACLRLRLLLASLLLAFSDALLVLDRRTRLTFRIVSSELVPRALQDPLLAEADNDCHSTSERQRRVLQERLVILQSGKRPSQCEGRQARR